MITNIKELINSLCDTNEVKENSTLYRGSIHNVDIYGDESTLIHLLNKTETKFINIEGGDCYSFAMKNDNERILVTYCEGDLTFEVCNNEKGYIKELARYSEFYINM
jgi:hypothetical protein